MQMTNQIVHDDLRSYFRFSVVGTIAKCIDYGVRPETSTAVARRGVRDRVCFFSFIFSIICGKYIC